MGLVTGTFLNIRSPSGAIRDCPECKVQGTQAHFLNICPVNVTPRRILAHSLPPDFYVKRLKEGDIALFYEGIREVKVEIRGNLNEEDPIPEDIYQNLGKAAMEMATVFVTNTLETYRKKDGEAE